MLPSTDSTRAVVRHLVATLAYRAAKVLRDVPPDFPTMTAGPMTRQPIQILGHMGDLMSWAETIARGEFVWQAAGGDDWAIEEQRFFAGLAALDGQLSAELPPAGAIEQLIQGALADALTHVGQLALMRGLAGAPVRPESYARAAIVAGRVGADQAPPGREFEGDASRRR